MQELLSGIVEVWVLRVLQAFVHRCKWPALHTSATMLADVGDVTRQQQTAMAGNRRPEVVTIHRHRPATVNFVRAPLRLQLCESGDNLSGRVSDYKSSARRSPGALPVQSRWVKTGRSSLPHYCIDFLIRRQGTCYSRRISYTISWLSRQPVIASLNSNRCTLKQHNNLIGSLNTPKDGMTLIRPMTLHFVGKEVSLPTLQDSPGQFRSWLVVFSVQGKTRFEVLLYRYLTHFFNSQISVFFRN